jgi:outer membrane usher protein FimD/PapC
LGLTISHTGYGRYGGNAAAGPFQLHDRFHESAGQTGVESHHTEEIF